MPFEALVAVVERGLVPDWKPVFAELRRRPWGTVARRVEQVSALAPEAPASRLFSRAVQRARDDAEAAERSRVAARVRVAIESSGLTAAALAAAVGTSASRLSTYATGRVIPSAAVLDRIERHGVAGDTACSGR